MQKRIRRVKKLIICSNYDNYMAGGRRRIDEQIFNEYVLPEPQIPTDIRPDR